MIDRKKMAILISIHPEHVENILDYKKIIELRKRIPDDAVSVKFYIYQTKHAWIYKRLKWLAPRRGKVVAEFVCSKIDKYGFDWPLFTRYGIQCFNIPRIDLYCMCLTSEEVMEYAGKSDVTLKGIHISDLKIYDKPKELSEFRKPKRFEGFQYTKDGKLVFADRWVDGDMITVAPQSWCWVEELE